ncbi:MAG: dephospho-CoA kinase [Bacteroidota bacterium]
MVGITGGIGSGKSTVSKLFEQLGIPVYNSDIRAKVLMHTDDQLIEGLKKIFGETIYDENKQLKNKEIASIVFNNATKLQQLNNLVHPLVKEDTKKWQVENASAPYLIKESAILFETGIYKEMSKNILVVAPMELRIERVMLRDNCSREDVQARINKQMSDEQKIPLADYIIQNDGIQSLILQVTTIHQNLLSQ